jgi:uncharacterized ferritin-like protein (DUF455 family)
VEQPQVAATELRQAALHWLEECEPRTKAEGVRTLRQQWLENRIVLDGERMLAPACPLPGRPARPELVPPARLSRRGLATLEGRAAMLHAFAHIEFNAINLALDAIWRFPAMPAEYYADWLQVAQEEAYHYTLLARHLNTLGVAYGDFPAHGGLWDMAERTCTDVLARMALIPRTMEARGLDVSPGLRDKLAQAGDHDAAGILDIILHDEIGHVRIGNRWFNWLCDARGEDPIAIYAALTETYRAPVLRGPFNMEARKAAGFTETELNALALSPHAPTADAP